MRDVIRLIRLNYDRAVANHGLPGADAEARTEIDGLHPLAPEPLAHSGALGLVHEERGVDVVGREQRLATRGRPYYAITDRADARRRIDAILERLRSGENR